jgi:four helix bundle protein
MITEISKTDFPLFNRGGGAKQFFPIHHTQGDFKMIEDMKIFHKTYEFLKWLHTLLNKFPKSEKYTMAQKIENTSLNFLESIIQSNNDFDKKQALQKAILELDKLRIFFRLSKDLQFISFDQYEYGSNLINEIGRMLGGWYKKCVNIP